MKIVFVVLLGGALSCWLACTSSRALSRPVAGADLYRLLTDPAAGYDSTLALQAGADRIGMKPYVMAFLQRGPNRGQDSLTAANLQKGHMDNINRLAEEGKLVVAGPFLDNGELRGIYIFNVETVEEARRLTESDPAVQAGRLTMELHPWYGSAALLFVNGLHNRVSRQR